jgi:hypothetical protein
VRQDPLPVMRPGPVIPCSRSGSPARRQGGPSSTGGTAGALPRGSGDGVVERRDEPREILLDAWVTSGARAGGVERRGGSEGSRDAAPGRGPARGMVVRHDRLQETAAAAKSVAGAGESSDHRHPDPPLAGRTRCASGDRCRVRGPLRVQTIQTHSQYSTPSPKAARRRGRVGFRRTRGVPRPSRPPPGSIPSSRSAPGPSAARWRARSRRARRDGGPRPPQ